LYRFVTQGLHAKTVASTEMTLRETCNATNGIEFNGTLEPAKDNSSKIGKERCIALLKKRVNIHDQQIFYYIKDTDGKLVDLLEHAHRFKLNFVIAEHERLMEENDLHESYNRIERDDCELSRGAVGSFSTDSFQEKIEIRFSHCEDFEILLGSCLFMMSLETCNASVFHDVEGAKKEL
jgi:hypothetical protein